MRIWHAFAIFLTLGCTDTLEIRSDLSGQWAAPPSVVGSGFDFTLTQIADSLHGSGSFAIEAGSAGTFAVRGAYTRPSVELIFTYESGARRIFTGRVDIVRMVGTVTDSAGHAYAATYVRR